MGLWQARMTIVNRIRWLARNLEDIQPDALTGDLVGFFKLRVGDYRVVYEILDPEQTIVIRKGGGEYDNLYLV